MGWQPIETAPENQKVLVWNGEAIFVAEKPFEGATFFVEPLRGRFITDWSIVHHKPDELDHDCGPLSPPITQWMPLPTPPA